MNTLETAFALEDHLPYLINRIASNGVRSFSRELDKENITVPIWRVIAVLWMRGAQRQIDLSELTSIDPSTLSRLIGTLTKMKLVTRERSTASSREVTVGVTEKGRQLAMKLAPLAMQYEEVQLKGFSREEKLLLKMLLNRVYQNIMDVP
jgi:MarR family transcriptional regulator, organic hydroperoxide resistance regulator